MPPQTGCNGMSLLPSFLDHWTFYWVAAEWCIRLVMLVYIPQKRSAAASRTWLLLVFFLPILGLLLYAIFGRVYYPAARRERLASFNQSIDQVRGRLPAVQNVPAETLDGVQQEIATLADRLGSFPIACGNSLQLLDHYDQSLEQLVTDIEASKRHVHLLMYIYADDDVGRRMTQALLTAAGRGVRCCVMLDAVGAHEGLHAFRQPMEAAGIEVVEMLPIGSLRSVLRGKTARFDLRNHRKIVVIDGQIGYIGSQNIVDKNANHKLNLPNEELMVRVTGPIVNSLQGVFLSDRFVETNQPIAHHIDFVDNGSSEQPTVAQVLPSGPGYGTENAQMMLVSLIYRAQRRIVITTPYFVPDESFLQALQAAAYRGVDVHLVLSLRLNQRFTQAAQESFYGAMLNSGVHIHLYEPAFLHAKHVTVDDDVAVIGSTNMDIRSFALNAEVALIVYDKDFVARVQAIQARYFQHSQLVDHAAWQRRPLHRRVLQNLAKLADSLL